MSKYNQVVGTNRMSLRKKRMKAVGKRSCGAMRYNLSLVLISWMRLAQLCREESSWSGLIEANRSEGVFCTASREKYHLHPQKPFPLGKYLRQIYLQYRSNKVQ